MKTPNILRTVSVLAASCCAAAVSPAAEKANVHRLERAIAVHPGERVEPRREPVTYLGIEVVEAPPVLAAQLKLPEGQGLVVNFIDDDSPAAKAGLQRHDVLLKLDDQILIDERQLTVLVRNRKEGNTVALTCVRAGAEVRVQAVLGKREAPVDHFRWTSREFNLPFGGQSGTLPLTHESVDRLRGRMERNMELFRGTAAPGVPAMPATPAAPRVMIFRPGTNIVFTDEAGTLELSAREDVQSLRATDPAGAVIFEGPVNTPDQRAALPEELRERMEKLEGIEVMEPPTAVYPPAMAAPFAPAAPAAPGVPGALFHFEAAPATLSGRIAPATL